MFNKKHDIIRTIERYVRLQIKGEKAIGLCPFHDDHNPSLQVDIRKQRFACYACGEWGDAISFVRKIEKCSFPDALRILDNNQILVTPKLNFKGMKQHEKKPDKQPVNHNILLSQLMPYSTGDNRLSSTYLEFEVGVAPALLPHPWKSLAGRLVFPIRDETGELRGFAGRKLTDDMHGPKYINTTAETGFKRSEILYGLHRALKSIELTGTVYITEGYKDTLAMQAAGFTNTVGLCGTEMTAKQIPLITKYATKAVIMLDGDEAGYRASKKISAMLSKNEMDVSTVQFPAGEDQDSFFRKQSTEEFTELIKHLSIPGSPDENILMALLFMYPDLKFDGQKTFAERIHDVHVSMRIKPAGYKYDEIIKYISMHGTTDGLSKKLTAALLVQIPKAEKTIKEFLSILKKTAPSATIEECIIYLMEISIFEYFRDRVTEELDVQTRKLKFAETEEERDEILKEIKLRKFQIHKSDDFINMIFGDDDIERKMRMN